MMQRSSPISPNLILPKMTSKLSSSNRRPQSAQLGTNRNSNGDGNGKLDTIQVANFWLEKFQTACPYYNSLEQLHVAPGEAGGGIGGTGVFKLPITGKSIPIADMVTEQHKIAAASTGSLISLKIPKRPDYIYNDGIQTGAVDNRDKLDRTYKPFRPRSAVSGRKTKIKVYEVGGEGVVKVKSWKLRGKRMGEVRTDFAVSVACNAIVNGLKRTESEKNGSDNGNGDDYGDDDFEKDEEKIIDKLQIIKPMTMLMPARPNPFGMGNPFAGAQAGLKKTNTKTKTKTKTETEEDSEQLAKRMKDSSRTIKEIVEIATAAGKLLDVGRIKVLGGVVGGKTKKLGEGRYGNVAVGELEGKGEVAVKSFRTTTKSDSLNRPQLQRMEVLDAANWARWRMALAHLFVGKCCSGTVKNTPSALQCEIDGQKTRHLHFNVKS